MANFATVQNESGRHVERKIEYYNLDVIKKARYSIILIDNYIDDTVITQLTKKKQAFLHQNLELQIKSKA